jgi:hypothetical protein
VTGSVCLRFDEALRELRYLKTIAGFFLERNESEKIERLAWELQGFQTSRTPSYRWQIPEATPIRTKTAADYEVRSTGCRVYGTISSVWEIEKVDGSRANQVFRTAGLASTTIKVYDASDDSVKADWNMDVGDAASPGCYFHAQSGSSGLPVPRFPSLAVTPAAAIEFALAELFQREWPSRAASQHEGACSWRRLQRNRIMCVLQWMHDLVLQSTGSPWSEYKVAKPPSDLFLTRAVYENIIRARST